MSTDTDQPHSKVFSSENAYTDHLNSRKHKEAAARPPSTRLPSTKPSYGDVAMMTPDVSDEAAVKAYVEANATLIPSLTCLFCPRTLSTLDLQLEHMHKDHGFFLPDGEYLVDAAGLVAHAAEEIGVFNTCLYCGAMFGRYVNENEGALAETKRAQRGLEAVRKHMNDKVRSSLPSHRPSFTLHAVTLQAEMGHGSRSTRMGRLLRLFVLLRRRRWRRVGGHGGRSGRR